MNRLVSLFPVLLLTACGVCPERAPVVSTDGGTWTCVVNTDCPRPANVLVCGQTEDQLRDCIACESNVCIRYQPKACK